MPFHALPGRYAEIAERHGLSPSALAILWCRTRPFIAAGGSTIVGATSLAQLEQNLDAFELPPEALTAEMVEQINEVHMRCRSPSDSL